MRVRFVVLKKYVESRLVLFDQIRFEHQRLDLVIDDDKLEIGYLFYKLPRFRIMISARLKVRPHTISQVLRLADIQDLAHRIFMNVDARTGRQGFEFVRDRHYLILTHRPNQIENARHSIV